MWLPKDERVLLVHYNKRIGKPNQVQHFELSKLVDLLKFKKIRKIKTLDSNKKWKKFCQDGISNQERRNRLDISNEALNERSLIVLKPHQENPNVIIVCLTLKGYDLGRKYSKRWGTLWIWCNEYKLWVILSVIIGLVGLIVTILVAVLKD